MDFRAVKGIVIDAGHGGNDPGASGNGIIEKDYNLEAAKYMNKRFNELGIPNKLTRTTDETLNSTERVRRILNAYGNDSNVIVLSNHLNAGGGDGAEVVYALRNSDALAKRVLDEIEKKGQNVRKYYQRRYPTDSSKDYYFIHRETGRTQPLLVEYGFLDSPGDDVNQLKNNFLDYVEAAVKAVAEYAGYKYVPPIGSNSYVVKSGDSLWLIAKNYGITVDELKQANNLSSNILQIGQVLTIPSSNPSPSTGNTYIVKSGDSLWNIAKKYGVSVDELKQANNLNSNLLQIGQVLTIPTNSNNKSYVVKSGDSLWKIAQQYGVSVDDIISLNNLNSNLLQIGQVLLIP